ncbi:hypothetical protein SprV_0802479300 [Sparganum proliferum]
MKKSPSLFCLSVEHTVGIVEADGRTLVISLVCDDNSLTPSSLTVSALALPLPNHIRLSAAGVVLDDVVIWCVDEMVLLDAGSAAPFPRVLPTSSLPDSVLTADPGGEPVERV